MTILAALLRRQRRSRLVFRLSPFFQRDLSSLNQIKSTRWFTFKEDRLPLIEIRWCCAERQQLDVVPAHSFKKRMRSESLLNVRIANRQWFPP